MESISEVPPDGGSMNGLNLNTSWTDTQNNTTNNSNILYIAVEYVKENQFKLETETNYTEFDQHVSPLDPNMSSVARYSPVYSSENTYENPVVVTQMVENNVEHVNEVPLVEDTNLQQAISNRFLQLVHPDVKDQMEIVPEGETHQEVELLITDQTTGISYLVERLAEDTQLLDHLSTDTLLDSDLLALDETALKTQLSEIIIEHNNPGLTTDAEKALNLGSVDIKGERRSQRNLQNAIVPESDDHLLSCVQQICDKPILSRARASLPESYLIINKNDLGENSIFARKFIPKRTQFGPIEGFIMDSMVNIKVDEDEVQLSIEAEDGTLQRLNTSDENHANWMSFVRLAENYGEQNLVLSQQECMLYYTTTKNIYPKQELLVGYGLSYASARNLAILETPILDDDMWPCYECPERFISSDLLHKHLDQHDAMNLDNYMNPRKKSKRKSTSPSNSRASPLPNCENEALQCTVCLEVFCAPKFGSLRQHLADHGLDPCEQLQDRFIIAKTYTCDKCQTFYLNADELQKHKDETHINEMGESQENIADELEPELTNESFEETETIVAESPDREEFKCPVCYKMFSTVDRIQRHMMVHGSEEEKPLECERCKKRFLNTSALLCHFKTHLMGRKVFECPMCTESFQQVLELKSHVAKHSVDGKYKCPHCKKIFIKYSIIRKHIRAFHSDRKHVCPNCKKVFATLDKLRMHLLKHSDHREFLCADCGKQFKRKDKLKEHCKRMHNEERENNVPRSAGNLGASEGNKNDKKFTPKVQPTDYHRFIYKCHTCMVGFKRRGMLVNHLAKRHPDISPDSVPELNLPILRATKDYYCNYCEKVYKSSSKRKAHILKNHPGAALPLSNRCHDAAKPDLPNPTYSQTVGSVTTHPQACQWCHKQYASKAKLLQHQRKKHTDLMGSDKGGEEIGEDGGNGMNVDDLIVHQDGNYYQLVSMDEPFVEGSESLVTTTNGGDSRLYRLLTTGNNLVPPR